MNFKKLLVYTLGLSAMLTGCDGGRKTAEDGFRYTVDEFADIKIMRYRILGWDSLTFRQKSLLYHLGEAAKYGRDILWDQNCKYNLEIRHLLEAIIEDYQGDRETEEWKKFETYAKRVFFSNGIHHHYAEDKIVPECGREYFSMLVAEAGNTDNGEKLLNIIYDPDIYAQRKYTDGDRDILSASAVNFYEGVTRGEAERFYSAMENPDDPAPVSYGLNSRLVRKDGKIKEDTYRIGGLYGKAIEKIVEELELASGFAENEMQKECIDLLISYYRTGDLRTWDEYNIAWVRDTLSEIDFVNGFVETYNDPLGMKGTWESIVNIRDAEASKRTETISENAQWFEDNSPVDSRFKKKEVKGISAKVIDATTLGGDCFPSTPIGINLPNADWIRKEHGSKSVTIANITHAYNKSAEEAPKSTTSEFAWDEDEVALIKKYSSYTDELHTDLHECLGHGSGQLLPGVSSNALGEYASALEEARADLFALYYMGDDKMVELGLLPDMEAYKAQYLTYIRNGICVQFSRVEPGRPNTEAHMQNRKLISEWCYEKGLADNVIEKRTRDGKTYFIINDYVKLRGLFGELLAEIQRIKSEGDYEAGKALIERYAIHIDPALHKEVRERYASLGLKPYGGFVNPEIVPVIENGETIDYRVEYTDDFLGQMLEYGKKYRTL